MVVRSQETSEFTPLHLQTHFYLYKILHPSHREPHPLTHPKFRPSVHPSRKFHRSRPIRTLFSYVRLWIFVRQGHKGQSESEKTSLCY